MVLSSRSARRKKRAPNHKPKKDAPPPEPKYGRVNTIAALLEISRASVWRLAARGVIPKPHRLAGNISVWCIADVLRAVGKRPLVDVVDTGLKRASGDRRTA
jgi:predicted DNA-binding transcriptional regulator AlpA